MTKYAAESFLIYVGDLDEQVVSGNKNSRPGIGTLNALNWQQIEGHRRPSIRIAIALPNGRGSAWKRNKALPHFLSGTLGICCRHSGPEPEHKRVICSLDGIKLVHFFFDPCDT